METSATTKTAVLLRTPLTQKIPSRNLPSRFQAAKKSIAKHNVKFNIWLVLLIQKGVIDKSEENSIPDQEHAHWSVKKWYKISKVQELRGSSTKVLDHNLTRNGAEAYKTSVATLYFNPATSEQSWSVDWIILDPRLKSFYEGFCF